ncbi:MAG: DUF4433 domain-containing protein [Rhodocyclaceae bacterium]|nr:DUF4433 domain-containing protein [Rhodocyclaceae bacterium]
MTNGLVPPQPKIYHIAHVDRLPSIAADGFLWCDTGCDLARLDEVDWAAVQARDWRQCKEGKQAEFLLEHSFPWHLIERIGVLNRTIYQHVVNALPVNGHRPTVEIRPDWYY